MIERRKLGAGGPEMGRIGYGAMVLEGYYGPSDDSQAVRTIHRALDLGVSMIDTADFYGNGHNEVLVGSALKGQRDRAFLCTKFGIVSDESESGSELMTGRGFPLKINGSASYAGRALDASLRRLKTDSIDLWYLHYPDPATPIEETVDAMAAAVRAGKVRYLGLSNVSAEQVRRAHAVHPIAAVQYEYSLWRREAERDLLPSLRELGIALVGWSPLGSGFLAGNTDTPQVNDVRNGDPRYSQQNLTVNRDRFAPLSDIAAELGITNAQLALAWLLHQGADIFPIPGTRREERVLENTKAASVHLNAGVLQRIDGLARIGTASGGTLL